eukprot:SAG31_NODE_20_length_34168_cov_33.651296_7_plen_94_part_00
MISWPPDCGPEIAGIFGRECLGFGPAQQGPVLACRLLTHQQLLPLLSHTYRQPCQGFHSEKWQKGMGLFIPIGRRTRHLSQVGPLETQWRSLP